MDHAAAEIEASDHHGTSQQGNSLSTTGDLQRAAMFLEEPEGQATLVVNVPTVVLLKPLLGRRS